MKIYAIIGTLALILSRLAFADEAMDSLYRIIQVNSANLLAMDSFIIDVKEIYRRPTERNGSPAEYEIVTEHHEIYLPKHSVGSVKRNTDLNIMQNGVSVLHQNRSMCLHKNPEFSLFWQAPETIGFLFSEDYEGRIVQQLKDRLRLTNPRSVITYGFGIGPIGLSTYFNNLLNLDVASTFQLESVDSAGDIHVYCLKKGDVIQHRAIISNRQGGLVLEASDFDDTGNIRHKLVTEPEFLKDDAIWFPMKWTWTGFRNVDSANILVDETSGSVLKIQLNIPNATERVAPGEFFDKEMDILCHTRKGGEFSQKVKDIEPYVAQSETSAM